MLTCGGTAGRGFLASVVLSVTLLGCSTIMVMQTLQQQQNQRYHQHSSQEPPGFLAHHIGQAGSTCIHRNRTLGLSLDVNDTHLVAPVVIVAHNRVHYLAKCMAKVLRHWEADPQNAERFPLFVSVDGGNHSMVQFAAAFNFGANVQVIHNLRDTSRCKPTDAYCNLSVHYHMLMQLFFDCLHAPRLIILEEDLEVAPDFFSYFSAFAPLLDRDKSLMCVSAWNDHGQRGRASDASAVYRTDIFPGLGWMLTADVGRELAANWPDAYWDEYLRRPDTRKGRQCLFPEVSRTVTFGASGASGGQHFATHLGSMVLNQEPVDWSKVNTSLLERDAYQQQMTSWLAEATPLSSARLRRACRVRRRPRRVVAADPVGEEATAGDLVVHYESAKAFVGVALKLQPMLHDIKGHPKPCHTSHLSAVPRASYRGVVAVRCGQQRLFIAPEPGAATDPATWPQLPAGATVFETRIANCTELAPNTTSSSSSLRQQSCQRSAGGTPAARWWQLSKRREQEAGQPCRKSKARRPKLSAAEAAAHQEWTSQSLQDLQQHLALDDPDPADFLLTQSELEPAAAAAAADVDAGHSAEDQEEEEDEEDQEEEEGALVEVVEETEDRQQPAPA